jgi:serine/threonine-protein kinase SRPK3
MDYKEEVVYPILADLGMAVFGEREYSHIIQPIPYRAPEVILGMKWNESVDIWNFGVLVSIYSHLTD